MRKKFMMAVLALLFLCPQIGAGKKDKYDAWLKEVKPIITDAEEAEFKKLKKEKDREFFVQLFWARRDPTPYSEKNEFKDEYYERLSYVKKSFLYGYKTGIDTDMGKVYLCFGKPKVLHPSTAASQGQQYPEEIWIYPTQPWMNIPQETFSFVFTHDGMGYVLDRARTENRAVQAFFAYPERALLYPDLKELPKLRKAITFSPDSLEAKAIEEVESSQEDIIQIPFEEQAIFTKAENVSSYLTFLLKVGPSERLDAIQERLVLFGRVTSEAGSYDFREERGLLKENDYFVSQVGLPVFPGEYDLYLGLATPDSAAYSLKKKKLIIPNFWSQELALSSLLASFQVEEKTVSEKNEEYNAFTLGRYSLTPFFSQEYGKDQSLNIFYYIYNMAVDENRNCSLLISMELQKGEQTFGLNPQKRKRQMGEEPVLLEGTKIPLSALPQSGKYELTIKVTDEITQRTASGTLTFTVR